MDIVNRNQNFTLPAVAIDVTNIRRNVNQVFNKNDNFYSPNPLQGTKSSIAQFRTPVPVQISVNMSIMAGYQLDLEQIFSNFAAYFNPYIYLATAVPSDVGPDYPLEVRTKATWSGDISIITPTEVQANDKFRRQGDTSFVLDSWIYPEALQQSKPIYFIDANFYSVKEKILDYNSYATLSAENFSLSAGYPNTVQHLETVSLSGTPQTSNVFFTVSGQNLPLYNGITFTNQTQKTLLLYGENYNHIDVVLLSSDNPTFYSGILPLTSLNSTYYGPLTGYSLTAYQVLNDSMLQVTLPENDEWGKISVITYNRAGWTSTDQLSGFEIVWQGAPL